MINNGHLKNDKFRFKEELIDTQTGQLILATQKHRKLIGELTVVNGLTNKTMFRFTNDIIIPGATFVLEKIFNRRSTFGMTTLSQDLAIKAGVSPTQENLKEEALFGFVVGNGGVETPDIVRAVKFKDKTVSSILPMRIVDTANDLSPTEQANYALKKQVGDKFYYYARKFDTEAIIRHLFTDGTEIPPNIDQVDTSLGLLVFGEIVCTISAYDLREYYQLTYGTIENCRFNSFGLIAGFPDGNDYAGVRVITKLNIPNMPLNNSEAFYRFTYKIYAI